MTEHPFESPKSFLGKGLRKGYQSHYTITGSGSFPTGQITPSANDELVIFEPAQALPKFIVLLKTNILQEYKRVNVGPSDEGGSGE